MDSTGEPILPTVSPLSSHHSKRKGEKDFTLTDFIQVVGIIPNFYGFLNNMGVSAPAGVTKAYYFAYEIGLFLSFFTYWLACYISPPPVHFPLSEWHEPQDYIRPFERGEMVEGRIPDSEMDVPSYREKDAHKVVVDESARSLDD